MTSISLVLPAYNEADNIEPVIAEATPALASITDDYEIVVVDDGSRDDTAAVAKRAVAMDPHVRLVQHPVNQGFGASVFSGFVNAAKEWILYTDADRQFVLDELARFVPLMDQADLIAGYRAPRRDPFLRVLYGKGWSMLCTLLFGYTVRDVDCGFKLLRRAMVDELAGSIAELPVSHRPRVAGSQTGANIKVITRAFRELWKLRMQLWREGPAGHD
jgi:glycosyltransferase involved in cell wall biosynthesis